MIDRAVRRSALWSEALFFLVTLGVAFASTHVPPHLMNQLVQSIKSGLQSGPSRSFLLSGNPFLLLLGIFIKNGLFLALVSAAFLLSRSRSATISILGIIIAALVALILLFNAAAGGLVVQHTAVTLGRSVWLVFLFGILPHGVFEIFSYAYLWTFTVFFRKRKERLRPVAAAYAVLFFAACVEALVTPGLIHLFL